MQQHVASDFSLCLISAFSGQVLSLLKIISVRTVILSVIITMHRFSVAHADHADFLDFIPASQEISHCHVMTV